MKRLNVFTVTTETDPEDPPAYRASAVKLGPLLGASMLGGSVYVLEPGQTICPYHCEFGNEEWLLVLEGRPTLRRVALDGEQTPNGEVEEDLEPGDVACFPSGLDGAHKVTNRDEAPVRVFMFSTMVDPCMSYYPDSEKYGVWPAAGEGFLVRRASGVDYYDGE